MPYSLLWIDTPAVVRVALPPAEGRGTLAVSEAQTPHRGTCCLTPCMLSDRDGHALLRLFATVDRYVHLDTVTGLQP